MGLARSRDCSRGPSAFGIHGATGGLGQNLLVVAALCRPTGVDLHVQSQETAYAELAKTAEDVFTKEVLKELAKEVREQADKLEQTEMG